MEEIVTDNLASFGSRERYMAGKLLLALSENNHTKFLGDNGLKLWMNRNSGNVFLCDEDFNTAMMNGDTLEDWINCPNCGHENFLTEFKASNPSSNCCLEYYKELMPEETEQGA